MPTSSDPFDEDDELFADPTTLDQLEASAIQSSQAAKPRVTQPYHHTIAKPRAGPSTRSATATFSGRKAPQPINTEPRAGNSGFGWEYGGKRSIDGNRDRHVAAVNGRAQYWSNRENPYGNDDDDDHPDIVMGEGGYEIGGPEVVDSHHTKTISAAPVDLERQSQAAAARRAAISAASQATREDSIPPAVEAGPSHLRANSTTGFRPSAGLPTKFPGPERTLSRSISAGHQPIQRSVSRGPPALSPIPSQGTSSRPALPSSQGSVARRNALALDEEKQKRLAAEKELAELREEMRKAKSATIEVNVSRMEVDGSEEDAVQSEDLQAQVKELQNQLWRAKGEAETIRRAQRDDHSKVQEQTDKLKADILNMEIRLKERDKEALKQLESVKSQAVFANYNTHTSAIKGRSASQRPAPTPMRNGSPRGKGDVLSMVRPNKGKGRAAPPPQPQFDSFKDAFSTSPTMSRVKRQRTEFTPGPGQDPPPGSMVRKRPIPEGSPSKNGVDGPPSSPMQMDDAGQDDNGMDVDLPPAASVQLVEDTDLPFVRNLRSELLHHLFHHTADSAYQLSIESHILDRPTIYRLVNYHPPERLDPKDRYAAVFAELLRACGDPQCTFEQLLGELAEGFSTILTLLSPDIDKGDGKISNAEVSALINILSLLGGTAKLFEEFSPILVQAAPSITGLLRNLLRALIAKPTSIPTLHQHLLRNEQVPPAAGTEESFWALLNPKNDEPLVDPDPRRSLWSVELAESISELCQGLCWYGGPHAWNEDELVDIALLLTQRQLDSRIIRSGLDLILAAGTFRENFRSVLAPSEHWPGDQPILERISRFLLQPPIGDHNISTYTVISMIRVLSMMSIAEKEAVILVADRSLVIPGLIMVLERESEKMWRVWADEFDIQTTLEIIKPALQLLHYLIFPFSFTRDVHHPINTEPTASQSLAPPAFTVDGPDPELNDSNPPQGVNIIDKIRVFSQKREFFGIGHQFIACFGAMSYGIPGPDVEEIGAGDLGLIQYLSQDILEMVVEGPEADAVYEAYADVDDEKDEADPSSAAVVDDDLGKAASGGDGIGKGKGRQKQSSQNRGTMDDPVDMDVYDAMSVMDEDEVPDWGSF